MSCFHITKNIIWTGKLRLFVSTVVVFQPWYENLFFFNTLKRKYKDAPGVRGRTSTKYLQKSCCDWSIPPWTTRKSIKKSFDFSADFAVFNLTEFSRETAWSRRCKNTGGRSRSCGEELVIVQHPAHSTHACMHTCRRCLLGEPINPLLARLHQPSRGAESERRAEKTALVGIRLTATGMCDGQGRQTGGEKPVLTEKAARDDAWELAEQCQSCQEGSDTVL